MPYLSLRSLMRLRICACTVTSSAVVGSSAIEDIGPVGERHGDHDALTLAARQLVRVLPQSRLGLGDLHFLEQLARRGCIASVRLMRLWRWRTSQICWPTV